jgi:hypothetical protein
MPFLKSATRSLDFATRGEDVFMVISSAFHAKAVQREPHVEGFVVQVLALVLLVL